MTHTDLTQKLDLVVTGIRRQFPAAQIVSVDLFLSQEEFDVMKQEFPNFVEHDELGDSIRVRGGSHEINFYPPVEIAMDEEEKPAGETDE